ncbi:hypothetical protein ACHAQH_005934 [Verticillium albo-atrum]
MLVPSVASATTQFYPIGNTPAINLTRDIPEGRDANILLLGCGDVRNILFTAYMQETLPRNIVLLSFVIDDADALDSNSLWNMYYHLYLDDSDAKTLFAQVKKLVEASKSMGNWESSTYGKALPFSDKDSFDDVRAVWLNHLKRSVQIGSLRFNTKDGEPLSIATGVRSAAPVLMSANADVVEENRHFWAHGTTGAAAASVPNPLIAASLSEHTTLHYGTDPILGFHLAAGFAPLAEASPLRPESSGEKFQAVAIAKAQFNAWLVACSSLFKAQCLIMRSSSADAFAFCNALQHQGASSGWYRRQLDSRVLKLTLDSTVPRVFDAIDTSNLADHFGTLNLLVSLLPLLALQPWATLSTEMLLKGSGSSDKEVMDSLLCGHAPTISLLLGISPVEYWTNATAVSKLHEIIIGLSTSSGPNAAQIHSRIGWKHNCSLSGNRSHIGVEIGPRELATIIFQMYLKMFEHENPMALLSSSRTDSPLSILASGYAHFHRGSFMALLKLLEKSTSVTNMRKTCVELDEMISRDQTLAFSGNQAQEMGALFHMHNLYTPDWLRSEVQYDPSKGGFNAWSKIPEVLAITLVVPRTKVQRLYTISPQSKIAAPTFIGSLRSSPTAASQWHNIFGDVHLAFGTVSTSGPTTDASFAVHLREDEDGWSGNTPLVVSFYVPAAALQAEHKSALIGLDVQTTPQSLAIYRHALGPQMQVYQARLDDAEHVYVTRYLPGHKRYPTYCAAASNLSAAHITTAAQGQQRFMVEGGSSGKITTVVGRLSQLPKEADALLKNKAVVKLRQTSPFTLDFVFDGTSVAPSITFPVPVDSRHGKIRVARQSGYVEAVVSVADPVSSPILADFVFPTVPASDEELNWFIPATLNIPHLSLDRLPILDLSNKDSLGWLTSLTSAQFSLSEARTREAANNDDTISTSARVNFKESLFTIFMIASGLQGGQSGLFAIDHPDRGGIHMLLFISAFRLDGASSSIVLDAAILPMTMSIITSGEIGDFLMSIRQLEICSITVDDDELILWKRALPALAERARNWSHKKSCEYATTKNIPLSIEPGEPVLCSCGAGKLPEDFVGVPYWDQCSKYATRIAISPTFAVPFVEAVFDVDGFQKMAKNPGAATKERCSHCRATTAKGSDGPLKKCSRCQTAKYCSAECQKKDWRVHRGECTPNLQ